MDLNRIILHYGPLSSEVLGQLEEAAELVTVYAGDVLLAQGTMCKAWYFNRNGLLRVSYSGKGKENTILFGSEGDVFTSFHSWFANEPASFSLIAIEDSEVYQMPFHTMRRLISLYPEMLQWTLTLLEGQMYVFERRYVKFANCNAEERLIKFLGKDFPKLERIAGKTIAQRIPLKYIASYLGIKPETLSRLRRRIAGK